VVFKLIFTNFLQEAISSRILEIFVRIQLAAKKILVPLQKIDFRYAGDNEFKLELAMLC